MKNRAAFVLTIIEILRLGHPAHSEPAPPRAGHGGEGLHGQRYCEVLSGAPDGLHVYNTIGLNECPEEKWTKLDAQKLKAGLAVDRVVLNGPRFWTLDRIDGLNQDSSVRTFGGIEMREVALSRASGQHDPYAPFKVRRDSVLVFFAKRRIYELVDPDHHVFVMQSYSSQTTRQTEDSLASLGPRLRLPRGWTFRTRVLDADLRVKAVNGYAQVVRDEFANAYQLCAK